MNKDDLTAEDIKSLKPTRELPHCTDMYWTYYIRNPVHGGKETCSECGTFVLGDKTGLPNSNFLTHIEPETGIRVYCCAKHYGE